MTTTLDPLQKSGNIALSGGNLVATSSGAGSVITTRRATGGFTYFEAVMTTLAGTPSIGLAASPYSVSSGTLGNDNNGIAYRPSGVVALNNTTLSTIATYAQGDRVCVAVDQLNKAIWFKVNAGNWNNSGTADPTANIGGISYATANAFNFAPALYASATGTVWTAAFDAFNYTPPTGYQSVSNVQTIGLKVTNKMTAASFNAPAATVGCYGAGVSYPVPGSKYISGTVTESGVAVAGKKVSLYDPNSLVLIGATFSDGSGHFSICAMGRSNVFAVAQDPTYQAIIYDQLTPV